MTAGLLAWADDGHGILHHLLVDMLVKGAIVIGGLVVLVLGMVVIWRKIGR